VHVKVDTLKFAIRDSNHDFLYKTLRPLATGLIKKQIQKAIRDALVTGLEYVDGQLVGVRDRIREEGEGKDSTGVLKSIFVGKKDTETEKEKVKDKAADKTDRASLRTTDSSKSHSHFKVVSDKRNSLLVNQGNPAGWVNRTAEKEKLSEGGDSWKSEAFAIVPEANR